MATQEIVLKFRGDPSLLKGALNELKTAHASTMADITRQQKAEASAATALQRQRSAAIITVWKADTRAAASEERQRMQAAISLQKQRSAALIAQWKADAREQARIAREAARGGGSDFAAALGFGGGVAGGITALVGTSAISSIRAGAAAWVNYASKLESTKIAFTTMLGSEQQALTHLKELQAFALKTPFQFEELIDASQRMQALGFKAEQVIPILTDVGNAVAAAGGGSVRLDRVVLALSQMQSKGRVATQELNQLAESGIGGLRILESHLGKSRAELIKMIEAGEISSAVFLEAFQNFSRINYGGLMEKQSKTFVGAMSNIKDAALALTTTALAPLFAKTTETTLGIGRFAIGMKEAADGAAVLGRGLIGLSTLMTGLNSIPTPAIIGILTAGTAPGLQTLLKGLALLGTPEIGALSVPGVKPVPLPTGESAALTGEAEKISALKAASEEAKRIATNRIADQERLFKLGKITREQETQNIIEQLKIRGTAENDALRDEIGRKITELQANRDNAEKVAAIIETISNLRQQIKNNESAVDRQVADKRAELELQERQNLIEHEHRKRDILLSAGQARIAVVESEIRAGIKSASDGASEIARIEAEGFEARRAFLDIQLANASKEPAERAKITHLIEQLEIERTANLQKQADRRTEITKQANANDLALNQQLISIRHTQREGELARIDALLERQAISESTAITHRLLILREEHEDRTLLLETERAQLTTSAEKKIELDNKKIESEQRYTDEFKRLTNERIDAINRESAAGAPGVKGGVEGDGSVQPGFDRALGDVPGRADNTTSAIDQLGRSIQANLTGTQFTAATAGLQTMVEVFGQLGQAVGQAAAAWVLYGNSGTSVRKLTAEVLASITQMAIVKAAFQLAEGFAALALAFFGIPNAGPSAAAHFTAAGIYAGIAGIAAVSGRVAAGQEFNKATSTTTGGGSTSSGGSSSGSNTPKTIEVDRRQGLQAAPLSDKTLTLKLEVPPGWFEQEFRKDYDLNGFSRLIVTTGR